MKTDLQKLIDARDWGAEQFYQDNTLDPALSKTPDAPTGISVTAVVDGILVAIDYGIDASHDSVANFEAYVVYARVTGDTAESAVEVGRIPYGMTTWTWQQASGGYTGYDVALTGISSTGYESAKSTWYRCPISTFHDDFSGYGNSDGGQDLESLYWLEVSDFDASGDWTAFSSSVANNATVGEFVEGGGGTKWTADSANDSITGYGIDVAPYYRFTATDYVSLVYYVHSASATYLQLVFSGTSGDFYYNITDLAAGLHYIKILRSDFSETDSPDWTEGQTPYFIVDNALTVTLDDLRLIKADPADATAFNDTGKVWDFNGGTWHIYDGKRTGEPAWSFSLGQIGIAASDFFFATAQNVKVTNGRLSAPVYFKGADGKAGLHFRCADDTLGSEDCLAVILDSAADLIYLVEWTAGGDAAVTNKALNPSAEAAANFAAISTATVTRDTAQARRGTYSYKVVTTATADEGISLTLSALSNAIHYVSYYIYDSITTPTYDPFATAEVSLDNSNWHVPEVIASGEGWARYGVQIPAAQANTSTTLYIRQSDATARTLYIDNLQVEAASAATAYADGSLGLGYSWSGAANASTSARVAGSPITWGSAAYTMAVDTAYWVGVDFRDPDNEFRVNVTVGTKQSDLFTADALNLSITTSYEWPDGGKLGLVAGDCNVRFGEVRAGSPGTADYAHQAGVAKSLNTGQISIIDDTITKTMAGTAYTQYAWTFLQVPLTSTSWDGDAKSGASGTIDLSAAFGAPAGIKAIACNIYARDETADVGFGLGPGSGFEAYTAVYTKTQVSGLYIGISGVVPCDANGDIYFYQDDELDKVYIKIFGYAI